jgi:hypothetical protein
MAAERTPERIDGPTPNGGTYALVFVHDDGTVEIVEYDDQDQVLVRTYSPPPQG